MAKNVDFTWVWNTYSSVGIATRYELHGLGIESRWGRNIPQSVQTRPEAHPVSYTIVTGSFPGVKRPGSGVDHPPPSSAEVKERVELYFYSPSGLSWSLIGWTFTFTSKEHVLYFLCNMRPGRYLIADRHSFPNRIWYIGKSQLSLCAYLQWAYW